MKDGLAEVAKGKYVEPLDEGWSKMKRATGGMRDEVEVLRDENRHLKATLARVREWADDPQNFVSGKPDAGPYRRLRTILDSEERVTHYAPGVAADLGHPEADDPPLDSEEE